MASIQSNPTGFDGYLTIGEAAELLGVSIATLRNWDRRGKFSSIRHPINAYRLYHRQELVALLARLQSTRGRTRQAKGD